MSTKGFVAATGKAGSTMAKAIKLPELYSIVFTNVQTYSLNLDLDARGIRELYNGEMMRQVRQERMREERRVEMI